MSTATTKRVFPTEEPENYNQVRKDLKALMSDLRKCRDRLDEIKEMPIFAESFSKKMSEAFGGVSSTLWLLGELYGYSLADDYDQKVDLKQKAGSIE